MEQTNDCRFQIFILTNSTHQHNLLFGRSDSKLSYVLVHNFLRKLSIKEVEMLDAVDDLKSSCSVQGIHMPDFGVLDARIASALNRIIRNFLFRRISLGERKAQEDDRFAEDRSRT